MGFVRKPLKFTFNFKGQAPDISTGPVFDFLKKIGLQEYANNFEKELISEQDLAYLDIQDLKRIGIPENASKRIMEALSAENPSKRPRTDSPII